MFIKLSNIFRRPVITLVSKAMPSSKYHSGVVFAWLHLFWQVQLYTTILDVSTQWHFIWLSVPSLIIRSTVNCFLQLCSIVTIPSYFSGGSSEPGHHHLLCEAACLILQRIQPVPPSCYRSSSQCTTGLLTPFSTTVSTDWLPISRTGPGTFLAPH